MKFGDDNLRDPIQQAFETQPLQAERLPWAGTLRQDRGVNPHPEVAQNQRDGDKHQPQMGVPGAGIDSRLPELAETRLDTEAFAIAFADFGWRPMNAPRSEQQLLTSAFLGPVMPVAAISYINRKANGVL